MSRLTTNLGVRIGVVLLAVVAVQGRAEHALYSPTIRVPNMINGQALASFAFDPVDHRLYAGSVEGVYWVDLTEPDPRLKGPILRERVRTIEVAPESGRLFYTTLDELGFANLRSNEPPKVLAGRLSLTGRLAYEPTRREMYVPTRDRGIVVYDTESGERGATIDVPGWYPTALEAVPGKVFFSTAGKSGLYVIDAATRAVAPWPVEGKVVTPVYLDADPAGKYLFATYDRYLVAIDIPSAKVVARRVTATGARIAYDPDRRLLVVAELDRPGHPLVRLRAFSVSDAGFTEVAELLNPADGQRSLESFRGGFLQRGLHSLLLWTAPPAS